MTNCLLETPLTRKNKISLTDYDYQKDIENRLLIAQLSVLDQTVLEEILYSSLNISLEKLSKSLELDLSVLMPILEKIAPSKLFTLKDDILTVDKDVRKYFELQVQKFDEDFQPGMEFLQSLLKKPPIHVLPLWYAIPRTSNSIFESIVEKNLLTPQIFLRYVADLNFGEPVLKEIIQDVYSSENLEKSSSFLIEKYKITRELFEEYMLHLEFSFVCCIGYKKNGDSWEEIVTPFHEWAEYLRFLKNTEVRPIQNVEGVVSKRPHEFSFVEDLSVLLEEAKKQPISIEVGLDGFNLPSEEVIFSLPFIDLNKSPDFYRPYIHNLIEKLSLLRLAEVSQKKLQITDLALNWLGMKLADKSLYFYRHPLNRILNKKVSQSICTEKAMREGEKSITRVLNKEWVFFDDFFQGIISPINEESIITLKRTGKSWRYALPNYSPGEKEFLRSIVLEWLFEAALVQVGSYEGRECFRVTTLGKTLFGR